MKNWWEFEPTQTYTRKLAQQVLKEDEEAQAQPTPTLGEALRPFGQMAWGAVKPVLQLLGIGGEYVGRPLRAAIGAAFEPGVQIQPTPGAGFFEPGGAYQQWQEYYPQARSLDPWGVEKFLTAEVLLDPLTWVGLGLGSKLPGLGARMAYKGGQVGAEFAKEGALAGIGRGLLKAEDIIEMPGRLAMRGVGALARPVTRPLGAWAQEAMQKVTRLPREAMERAGRLATGEAGMFRLDLPVDKTLDELVQPSELAAVRRLKALDKPSAVPVGTFQGKRFWSDGFMLDTGPKPTGKAWDRVYIKDIDADMLVKPVERKALTPLGTVGEATERKVVMLTDDGDVFLAKARQYSHFARRYPDVRFESQGLDAPALVLSKDEIVGAVMPVVGEGQELMDAVTAKFGQGAGPIAGRAVQPPVAPAEAPPPRAPAPVRPVPGPYPKEWPRPSMEPDVLPGEQLTHPRTPALDVKMRVEDVKPWDEIDRRLHWKDKWQEHHAMRLPDGSFVEGEVLTPATTPPRVYHFTTNLQGVLESRKIMGAAPGLGLGGGAGGTGVSFTRIRAEAELMDREVRRMVALSQGAPFAESLGRWVREDEMLAGLPERSLRQSAEGAIEWYDFTERLYEDPVFAARIPGHDVTHTAYDAYNQYLIARSMAGGPKNPIFFGSAQAYKAMNPGLFGILEVPQENLFASGALVRSVRDVFSEIRVHGDVPTAGMEVALTRGPGVPTAGLREPPLPTPRPAQVLPELPAAAARAGRPAVPEPEIPVSGLERFGQPTVPPGAAPPVEPPTVPPGQPTVPGFATTPPDPQRGWILPEVLPNAEIRRLHEQPDYLRKLMGLAEEHFPPLAKAAQWIGESGTNPTSRIQVLYGTIRAEGEAAAMAGGARLRAFGDVDELFNVTNGIANVGGKRASIGDVLEGRIKGLNLSPEQLAYQKEGWQLTDNMLRLLYDNRIDVAQISVPGGHYWPRSVVARQMPDGTLELGVIQRSPGGRWLAAQAGFEKARHFETMAEGMKEGFQYLDPSDAMELHLRAGYRRIANTRALEEIIEEIPHKVVKKKPFGMVGLPGVPGRWWVPEDIQGVREILQDTSFRLSEKAADVLAAASNIPRTIMTVADLGPAFLQLFGMATTHPHIWSEAVGTAFKSGIDDAAMGRFMRVPKNAATVTRLAPYGLTIHGPSYPAELVAGAGQFLGKIPVIGGIVRKGAAIFDNMMTAARVLMAGSLDRPSYGPDELADVVRFVNAFTGVTETAAQGIPRLQQKWESALLFAPRYYRATMMVMADIVHGGLRGKLARQHLATMAGAGLLGYMGLCKMLGQEPKLDPREKGQWLTFEIADQHVGIGGSMFMLLRTAARSIRDPEDLPDFAWQFLRGRLAPGVSTAMDVLRRRDFMGAPLDTFPKLTKRIVQDNLTPIWIQGVLESGERDWKEHVAVGAAELAGLRTFPVSVWTKRNRLSEQYAQETFARPWAELSGGEKYQVQQAHPDLDALVRQSWAVGKERGYRSSMFWGEVEEQRQPFQAEIAALNQQLQAGRLSGTEYREAVQDREMLMARVVDQLKATEEWADIPITAAEKWTAAGKEGAPPAPGTLGDQFTQEYYQIVADARDPQTGLADAKAIVRGREALKARYPAAVVATEMRKIDRKRHPLYVKARELNTQYYRIPKYIGLTEEQGDRADEFAYRYSYARRMNPNIEASRTKAILAQQDPEGYQLYRYSLKNRNPERKAFYAANPLLWRFYGELTGEEMEEIAPMLGAELPGWGDVMSGGAAMPAMAQAPQLPWYERVMAGAR